jgi:transcriptional regulator GlxA family with amidase domain
MTHGQAQYSSRLPATSSIRDLGKSVWRLQVAEEFIRTNVHNPVEIADIATAAGMNTRSLQRLFRKWRAATPLQILLHLRLTAARQMILQGDASSVREVAAKLHFANPSRFSKLYRQVHSYIPSEEIRQYRNRKIAALPTDESRSSF